MDKLDEVSWPVSRLGEAIEALARTAGLTSRPVETPTLPEGLAQDGGEAFGRWIEMAAGYLGLEAEPVDTSYAEVERLVRGAGPALLRLSIDGEWRFLAVVGARRRAVYILGPDRAVHRFRPEVICAALCQELERPLATGVDCLLVQAGIHTRHRARVREAILRQHLRPARIGGCWLLRLAPGASVWEHVRHARLPRHFFVLIGAHTAQYILVLFSWWTIGRGVLQGRLDWGWFLAWVLLLCTTVPLRLVFTWSQGLFAIGAAVLLKQRLLYGALRVGLEEMRHQGAGQLFGRVMESEAVDSLALNGGFLALAAGIELVIVAVILGLGAGGALHALLFMSWVVIALLIGWHHFQYQQHWTEARFGMTHDLVERMVGHRTRLAQELRERWHTGEDEILERYFTLSRKMDRDALLQTLVPGGWLVLGLLGLTPAVVSGQASPGTLAVSLAGLLFGSRALSKVFMGMSQLMGAAIAWKEVAPFFHAAARPEVNGSPTFAPAVGRHSRATENGQPLLEAYDLTFRYRERGEPVLRACSLQVWAGDRLLLEGASGGGKSTLASLLGGLRLSESGLLLLRGLDRQTLGSEGWRRRVVDVPQFHENHVLTGTFAFNLLMGRRWPPLAKDLQEAEALCRELGLGNLLDRMPSGLSQMVGESGWQLSHGERSRLYIARALLQDADLVILDESMAALDPETLRQSLRCVLDRAPTLLVIAHP